MQLQSFEVELLRTMQEGLRTALVGGSSDDPIVARLFPRAVDGDDDADAELRGMVHDELLSDRLDALDELVALLERGTGHRGVLRVDLEPDEAVLVLGVLNDLRLSIGARIGIEDLDRREVAEDDPVAYRLAVMDHLAWLQEHLLAVLDPPSVSVHDEIDPEDLT
jgi:hypothetical protein